MIYFEIGFAIAVIASLWKPEDVGDVFAAILIIPLWPWYLIAVIMDHFDP